MTSRAERLVATLVARRQSVAVCESLTGGLLGAVITGVPGSSEVFRGGLITYATDLKTTLAGVDESLVRRHGVVSAQVAEAMATGSVATCGADWGIATTGVAGPEEVDGLPPGTVWVGICGPGVVRTRLLTLAGDRAAVRAATVDEALGTFLACAE